MKKIRVWIKKQLYKPIIELIESNIEYHRDRYGYWEDQARKTNDPDTIKCYKDKAEYDRMYMNASSEILHLIKRYNIYD